MNKLLLVTLVVISYPCSAWANDVPLRARIDQQMNLPAELNSRCSDLEFYRRVSLGLNGIPPSVQEARDFMADESPDKRERLVDRLLASPHYSRHLANMFDLFLMERRINTHVDQDSWKLWLVSSIRANKPWNVMAREILTADGDVPEQRPAARFALDRAAEPNLLTRDIGRLFFGKDMQCAQCHDHPTIDDYLQADYHGLQAFIAPGYAVAVKKGEAEVTVYGEQSGSDLKFESVFIQGTMRRTAPHLPDGGLIDEPFFLPGEEYTVPVVAGTKAVPKFSRRAMLAELATNGQNRAFNENIANRLWAMMFGRGLVYPLDMHHSSNPPSHAELLRMMGEEFANSGFDIRNFLKELVLTEAYQRAYDVPSERLLQAAAAIQTPPEVEEANAALKEQARLASERYDTTREVWEASEQEMLPIHTEFDAAKAAYAEALKNLNEKTGALNAATAQLQSKQDILTAVQAASSAAAEAVKKLPEDAELVAASQKFTERTQQLQGEVAGFQKTVDEVSPQIPGLTEAHASTKQALEENHQKVIPLRAKWKQHQDEFLEARREKEHLLATLRSRESRHRTVENLNELTALQNTLNESQQAVAAAQARVAELQQLVQESEAKVAQQKVAVDQANMAVVSAQQQVQKAQQELTEWQELAKSVGAALENIETSRAKLPEDAVLTESAAQFRSQVEAIQARLVVPQQKLNEAALAHQQATDAVAALRGQLEASGSEVQQRQQELAAAHQSVVSAQEASRNHEEAYYQKIADVQGTLANEFTLTPLSPLTPEQICWSIFKVTMILDHHWNAEVNALNTEKPLTDEQKADAAFMAEREFEIEQRTFDKLKGNIGVFVRFYGAERGEPQENFFATPDQALYALNGDAINAWVHPRAGNVTLLMTQMEDLQKAAEELYLTVLTRFPTPEETARVVQILESRKEDKEAAVRELVWGLVTSAEFRFNH